MEAHVESPQAALAKPDEYLLGELTTAASAMEMAVDDLFEKKGSTDHSANNWASEIGHPCARNLAYCRTHWRERQPFDIDALYRLEAGTDEERKIKHKLESAGFEITMAQQHFAWPEYQISGRIDGKVLATVYGKRRPVPIEVKMINPLFWDKTKTIEDVRTSRNWWIRKYVSQLNVYLFMDNSEGGFLALCCPGKRPRILPMLPDYDLADADLAKATLVNKHILAGTLPEPMPYDPSVCRMCDFFHLCQPLEAMNTKMVGVDPLDAVMLAEYLELKRWNERYEEAKAALIGTKEKPGKYYGLNGIAGDITITSTIQQRTFYSVPDDIKRPFAEKREITITKIERVGE